MRSPVVWLGGKHSMVLKLLPLLPPAQSIKIYVEVFGGGANLLFSRDPAGIEVYNDLDSGLVNFFRVLRDPKKIRQILSLCNAYAIQPGRLFILPGLLE
jgi:DNA adenine methylase